MQKKYKIYERVETSLETKIAGRDWTTYTQQSIIFRTFEIGNWEESDNLFDGFKTIKEAEKFIVDNIEEYDKWVIITEYAK